MLIEVKALLLSLALITPRAFVCLAILPGFGTRTLVGIARNAVAIAIALPAVIPTYLVVRETPPDLVVGVVLAFKEGVIGALIGVLLAIPIWVIQSVGSFIDLQRTPVLTQNLNVSQDQDASALGALILQAHQLNVDAAEQDPAFLRFDKGGDKLEDRRFPRARGTDKGGDLAGFGGKA